MKIKVIIIAIVGVILLAFLSWRFDICTEEELERVSVTFVSYDFVRHSRHSNTTYFVAENGVRYVFDTERLYRGVKRDADALIGKTFDLYVIDNIMSPSDKYVVAWEANGEFQEGTLEEYNNKEILGFVVCLIIYAFFSLVALWRNIIDFLGPLFSKLELSKRKKVRKANREEKEARKKRYEERISSCENVSNYIHSQKNISRKKLKRKKQRKNNQRD